MSAEEIHVGDSTEFRATVYDGTSTVDLSGLNTTTSRFFTFKKPAGTYTTQTAVFFGSGTAGVLAFTSSTSTLDAEGEWALQLTIVLSSGTFHSDVYKFTVHPNI